jgi:hypothetical protein
MLDFLRRQAIPLLFVSLIVFPLLTRYITTVLFYRRAKSKSKNKTPPVIPYYAPAFYHALNLAYLGPQRCLAQIM